MSTLHIYSAEEIQGEFTPKAINLMIVFQVNCPGCIASALPMIQNIYESKGSEIGVVGLSTAFQYYDKNNMDNTRRLLSEGHLVGHSLEIMEKHGYKTLPYQITFPILMDDLMKTEELNEIAETMFNIHAEDKQVTVLDREVGTRSIKKYLSEQEKVYKTFAVNQFRGSPSFVLFDNDYHIIEKWFGHTTKENIEEKISDYTKR